MASTDGLCIFVCLLISIIGEVEGAIIYPPSNTVAEVNGEAIFNCSTTSSPPFAWILTRDGGISGEIIIATGCTVNTGLQNHYRTEQPGGQETCNLIVFDITMEQAGVYHCTETDTYRALLTVLASAPDNKVNSTTGVVENESVISECSLNYNGSMPPAPTLRPYFYWTNSNGQNVSSYNDSTTETTAVTQLAVTAARENIKSYTCHVYLQLIPAATGGYANNTPFVDMSDSSPTIEVLYGIGPVYVSYSIDGEVHLTCNTTGNPAPNYFWTGPNDITNISQPTIQIYTADYYECNATNVIREEIHSNASGINITENYPMPTTLDLVLSAVIPFLIKNLIVFVVFVVCINCKKPFGVAMTNRFKWLKNLQHCSMDEALEIVWCICFVIGSLAFGIIVIPVLITIAFCSGSKASKSVSGHDAPPHEMCATENQTGQDHKETGHAEHVIHADGKKGSKSKGMIVLMWCLVPVALVPIAFIVFYFWPYNKEMVYEIV